MTASQLKSKINKTLETAPEEVLEAVLKFIQDIGMKQTEEGLDTHLDKILKEDREVLEKLAK